MQSLTCREVVCDESAAVREVVRDESPEVRKVIRDESAAIREQVPTRRRPFLSNPYQSEISSDCLPSGPRENTPAYINQRPLVSYRCGTPDCSSSGRKLTTSSLQKFNYMAKFAVTPAVPIDSRLQFFSD